METNEPSNDIYIKSGIFLTENEYCILKNIITKTFVGRMGSDKITNEFIKVELNILKKHIKLRHSHHLTLYSKEDCNIIKQILLCRN